MELNEETTKISDFVSNLFFHEILAQSSCKTISTDKKFENISCLKNNNKKKREKNVLL